ncbi:helix-turn-helix domain-containing protein [Cohnella ginsengisoli]|uniref:Helix-turn-helix domain-containing protein n=1 Tax=Cohnella ginsengisoli TaxID=425004 RepID=A0A9X4QKT0_9BACL|nr:helix-turn-helix transcriptional regulator [Cohnella ginsengisoli]MDG0789964.1 helix-turn-helix domain-containing protein [Cohnella ginsengisoli]
MEIYFHIGRKLKELREKLGYKQLEVADKINMTRSSVANIEQGRQKIQIDVLYELAYLYDVDPKDLLPDLSMITKYQEVDDKVKIQNDKTKMLNLINKLREGEGK